MKKQLKQTINVVLASVALAMGVAVIVLSILDENVTTNDLVKMLAIAIIALSIFTLNKVEEKNNKTE